MIQFILYVKDQQAACDFYKMLLDKEPILDVPGMTEFLLEENCKLGLMPENGIAKILGNKAPHPASGNGIPRCELYLLVHDVEETYARLKGIAITEISPLSDRDWGDRVAYFADTDGHIIAIAGQRQ